MAGLDLKKLFISNSNAPVLVLTKCLLFILRLVSGRKVHSPIVKNWLNPVKHLYKNNHN
jgi:hypothetical protein